MTPHEPLAQLVKRRLEELELSQNAFSEAVKKRAKMPPGRRYSGFVNQVIIKGKPIPEDRRDAWATCLKFDQGSKEWNEFMDAAAQASAMAKSDGKEYVAELEGRVRTLEKQVARLKAALAAEISKES